MCSESPLLQALLRSRENHAEDLDRGGSLDNDIVSQIIGPSTASLSAASGVATESPAFTAALEMPVENQDYTNNGNPPSEGELVNISVKELYHRLQGYDPQTVNNLKQRRRMLKNRGYAQKCRIRRQQCYTELEAVNKDLKLQNELLRQQVDDLKQKLYWYESSQGQTSDVYDGNTAASFYGTNVQHAVHGFANEKAANANYVHDDTFNETSINPNQGNAGEPKVDDYCPWSFYGQTDWQL